MKILHLFSNWKWTGPAEPAVNLGVTQASLHEVRFFCGRPPRGDLENEVAAHARARGLSPDMALSLKKHLNPWVIGRDLVRLRRILAGESFDLIHTHLRNDHFLAGMARGGRVKKNRSPLIVRSFYGAEGPEKGIRSRWLLRGSTDGAVVISLRSQEALSNHFGFSLSRSAVIPAGVDTTRFDPDRVDRPSARARHGIGERDFVFGIVARMQRHRRFELLLAAMERAMAALPDMKLLIVGRGTNREEVAMDPVRHMGLQDRILFTGYLGGDDYIQALRAMDCAIFLVPGSDGSCRAVREKMAMGLPVIAARRPPLDEMIENGRTGFLVALSVEELEGALLQAAKDREATAAMAEQAKVRARTSFSLENQVREMEVFYDRLKALGPNR